MLTPTHVQVAVLHTKDLISKGKNGTNDAYIVFALGKQKFQSSTKEKASDHLLEWNEGCDIPIPASESNKSEIVLKVLHKASIGDKFLGRVALPLSDFDVTARPRPKWYPLKPKSGNEKDTKYRGEIEVRVSFLIKSSTGNGSTNDLATKAKQKDSFRSSLGSILSLGKKKNKKKKEEHNGISKESLSSSIDSSRYGGSASRIHRNNNLPVINDDPGVGSSEDEEEDTPLELKIDNALKNSSTSVSGSIPDKLNGSLSSLPTTPKTFKRSGLRDLFDVQEQNEQSTTADTLLPPATSRSSSIQSSPKPKKFHLPSVIVEEEASSSSAIPTGVLTAPPTPEPPPKLSVSASMSNLMDASSGKGSVKKTFRAMFTSSKHLSVDDIYQQNNGASGNSSSSSVQNPSQRSPGLLKRSPSIRDLKIPKETFKQYERKSKEELVAVIVNLQSIVDNQKQKIGDLEDYIDKLLLKVLDNMPVLLKNGGSVRK